MFIKIKSIILGLDPGTYISYSLIDLDGNVLKIRSAKGLNLSSLIEEVSSYGKILAVGTDKYPTPSFVRKFASIFGAKLIELNRDIKIEKKQYIVRGYKIKNRHERDSLAAALIAYKRMMALFNKIDRYLGHHSALELSSEVKCIMTNNSAGLTLYEAVEKARKNKRNIL